MRLVDADELIERIWRDNVSSRERIAKIIEDAPTVDTVRIPMDTPFYLELTNDGESECRYRMNVDRVTTKIQTEKVVSFDTGERLKQFVSREIAIVMCDK